MIFCHSAIERPYFFSMEGKYEAGPCFGHGADCSVKIRSSRETKGVPASSIGVLKPRSSARRDVDLPADAEPVDEAAENVAPEHLLQGSLDGPAVAQSIEDPAQVVLLGTDDGQLDPGLDVVRRVGTVTRTQSERSVFECCVDDSVPLALGRRRIDVAAPRDREVAAEDVPVEVIASSVLPGKKRYASSFTVGVFLYGARDSGLGHGQISPRAVRPYNLVHSFGGPACLLVAGIWLPTVVFASGLTGAAHIAFDRGLGFAKRSPEGYQKAARPKGAR
jgi:Domain of unknown function (DUF4260)